MKFEFHLIQPEQKQMLLAWLEQPHIREWLHGKGLNNLLKNLDSFFFGSSDWSHWIGYDGSIPFCYLLTTPEGDDGITLDLFICDLRYLGKGLSVPMIHQFLLSRFPHIKKVFIDPEKSNARAIHVYQKAGFRIVGEFIASWHPVPHYQMVLDMATLGKGGGPASPAED